jgi:hypothetical protein
LIAQWGGPVKGGRFPALLFADDSRTTSPARVVGAGFTACSAWQVPRPARISA